MWPYPRSLVRLARDDADGDAARAARALLSRALFVDAKDDGARLWAVDLAVRCRALAAVVADGSGFSMAATRRLALAAEAGRAVALLARPPQEVDRPSAAALRWLVRREPADARERSPRPRWSVVLLRAKGTSLAASDEAARSFVFEGDPVHGVVEGALALPADGVDRPRAASRRARGPASPRARGLRGAPRVRSVASGGPPA